MYIAIILLIILLGAFGILLFVRRETIANLESISDKENAPSSSDFLNSINSVKTKSAPNFNHLRKVPILTADEISFFYMLQRALPNFHIFPQVAFSGVIQPALGLPPQQKKSIFRFFAQKRFDFVVCTRDTFEVIANIELDGKTHETAKSNLSDQKRDKLVEAAGYAVHRFSWRRMPSEQQIQALFTPDLPQNASHF